MVLDPNQIQVDRPISLLEEQAAERVYEEEKEKVTFGQAVDAAFAEENTMSWIFNGLEDHEPDIEFDLTPELIEQYTEGVPEDRKDYVADAVSLPHLQKLHDRAKESLKNQDTLAKYGWGGLGLQVAAATLDVPAITATIATEGIAAPLIFCIGGSNRSVPCVAKQYERPIRYIVCGRRRLLARRRCCWG